MSFKLPSRRGVKIKRADREDRTYNGVVYDSKLEMHRAVQLDQLLLAGSIWHWQRQVKFQLGPDFTWVVDFMVYEIYSDGTMDVRVEEVKGWEKPDFKKTIELWMKYGRFHLHVFTGNYKNWEKRVYVPPDLQFAEPNRENTA